MDLSIIIVNYKNLDVTKKCIASIVQFTKGLQYEIIVVDNSPTADSKFLLHKVEPNLIYLESQNLGFGHANNKGMNVAQGSYILLLNSDTELIENSLLKCVNKLNAINRETNSSAMLGCQLINKDHSFQHSFFPFLKDSVFLLLRCTNPIFYKMFRTDLYYQYESNLKKVGDISGAFMMFNRELFEITKGFDTDFFMYYEESDWCRNRIKKHFGIYYFPETKVIHIGSSSTKSTNAEVQRLVSQGLFWYKKGKFKYLGFLLVQMINLLTFLVVGLSNKKYIKDFNNVIKASRYWVYDIFNYTTEINSNKQPLMYRSFFR